MSCAVGAGCTFVLNKDGELYSWGDNNYSELGLLGAWPALRDLHTTTIPTRIRDAGTGVRMVTAQTHRVACVMRDGTVLLWGRGHRFPFPPVLDLAGRNRPLVHVQQNELEGERATQVACNQYGWHVVTDTGSVFAGMFVDTPVGPDGHIDNTNEAMRYVSESDEFFFRQIFPTVRLTSEYFGRQPIKMVAAGFHHVLACGVFRGLWSWGANAHGCLGLGLVPQHYTSTPVPVSTFDSHRVTWVAAGPLHSMSISAGTSVLAGVLCDDAGVYGWGSNVGGELGVGYEEAPSYKGQHVHKVHLRPIRIAPAAFDNETITMIACAAHITTVISDSGKMWLFGNTSRMACKLWARQHALHSRGINIETGRARAGAAVQGQGSESDVDSSPRRIVPGESDDSDDLENETVSRYTPMETKYLHTVFPQRVLQRHFLGARIVHVAAGDTHVAATTEDGHLYMFYGGIIPVLYRPYCTALEVMKSQPVLTSQKQYFGGQPLAVRLTDLPIMSRRDVALYASGRFRSSSEYRAYVANTQTRQQRKWAKQEAAQSAAVAAATTACTAADSGPGPS